MIFLPLSRVAARLTPSIDLPTFYLWNGSVLDPDQGGALISLSAGSYRIAFSARRQFASGGDLDVVTTPIFRLVH
jgi:hypothetical protein